MDITFLKSYSDLSNSNNVIIIITIILILMYFFLPISSRIINKLLFKIIIVVLLFLLIYKQYICIKKLFDIENIFTNPENYLFKNHLIYCILFLLLVIYFTIYVIINS